jgi:hypothetical protein
LVTHFEKIAGSNFAAAAPYRIRTLVHVVAWLSASRDSLLSLSQSDADSQAGFSGRVVGQRTHRSVELAGWGDRLFNDCPARINARPLRASLPSRSRRRQPPRR